LLERGAGQLPQRQLSHRRVREVEEARPERVADAADVDQESVRGEGVDHAVGGRLGQPRRLGDGGERPRAGLDGVDDVDGAIEHADLCRGCGGNRRRAPLLDRRPVTDAEVERSALLDLFA
jgi:hypothetical protein